MVFRQSQPKVVLLFTDDPFYCVDLSTRQCRTLLCTPAVAAAAGSCPQMPSSSAVCIQPILEATVKEMRNTYTPVNAAMKIRSSIRIRF